MNPLAQELNDQLKKENGFVYEMLSQRGKELFFPKGILSQSAEAKSKAKKFNATIGIATEGGTAMYLPCIQEHLEGIAVNESGRWWEKDPVRVIAYCIIALDIIYRSL